MTSSKSPSKIVLVLLAVAVIVVLAGSLGARLISQERPEPVIPAPRAFVPQPAVLEVAMLEVPCWTCPSSKDWPLRFQTDLDLLAPLGEGSGNAAEWFGLFTKEIGPRADEALAAADARVDGPEWVGKVLPPDHPLLLEAEPWVDQATMKFYPQIYPLDGYDTRVTNLLFALNLARSWIARGLEAEDSPAAMSDFRRAIRLGRLLRQEDIVIINDLVGLACIHLGTRGVYVRALADGDLETALVASVVLGEVAAQRLGTRQRLTSTDLADSIVKDDQGDLELVLRPGKLDALIETSENSPDRRFRAEAIIGLNTVRWLGSVEESARAFEVLDALAGNPDPVIAADAIWSRDHEMTREQLKVWESPPQ
jgi:hypothetical protein